MTPVANTMRKVYKVYKNTCVEVVNENLSHSFDLNLNDWLELMIDLGGGVAIICHQYYFNALLYFCFFRFTIATSLDFTCAISDGGECSICYDYFKATRYLPCKHSFCQDCLYSYIASHVYGFLFRFSLSNLHCLHS